MSATAKIHRSTKGFPVASVDCILISDCDSNGDEEVEQGTIEHLMTLSKDYELEWRIYRTCAGLRAVCVSDCIKATSPLAIRVLEDLGCDPAYVQMVKNNKEFSARLGAKPQRIGIPVEKKFNYLALLPRDQRQWAAAYDAVAPNYKACEFVLQTAECEMPSGIANFIALHDERTKCFSDLPMA